MKINLKKSISLFLAILMTVSMLAACGQEQPEEKAPTDAAVVDKDATVAANTGRGTKIGVIASPLGWGEENYRSVSAMMEKYGEENFVLGTYPEDEDVQTVVSICQSMARDPEVGVIIIDQAAKGSVAGGMAINEINPDILTIAVCPLEEPVDTSSVFDIVIQKAFIEFGEGVAEACKAKGINNVVFYMQGDQTARADARLRYEACEALCKEYGIQCMTTILPTGTDASIRAACELAVKEDVENKLNEYGDDVFFFNCAFGSCSVPIINTIVDRGMGYFAPTDAGPFADSYSAAFSISAETEDQIMNAEWTNREIAKKAAEVNCTGRFANWSWSLMGSCMTACIEFGRAYQNGEVEATDYDALKDYIVAAAGVDASAIAMNSYDVEGVQYPNFFVVNSKLQWYGEDMGVE